MPFVTRSKRLISAFALAASAGLGISAADAQAAPGFAFDLRVRGTGLKDVTVTAPGDVVTLDLFVSVTGADADLSNDSIVNLFSLFKSSQGGLLGDLLGLTPPAPFNLVGSTPGEQRDLDGDGDFDIGSNDPAPSGDVWYFSRGGTPVHTVPGGTRIASVRFTAVQLAAATTQVTWVAPANAEVPPILGQYDGLFDQFNSSDPRVTMGAPITIHAAQVSSGGTTEFLNGNIATKLVVDHTIRQGAGSPLILTNGIDVRAGGVFDARDSAGHYTTQQIQVSDATSGNAGGAVFVNSMVVGQSAPGTYSQTTGLTQIGASMTLGATAGNAGTLDISGGSLRAATLTIGAAADGYVRQTGGFTTATRVDMRGVSGVNSTLDVSGGVFTMGSGTIGGGAGTSLVRVHGDGQVVFNSNFYLNSVGANHGLFHLEGGTLSGGSAQVANGATFDQTGGNASTAALFLGSGNEPGPATYNLIGGSMNLGGAQIGGGPSRPATLLQTAGVLNSGGYFFIHDLYDFRAGEANFNNLWILAPDGDQGLLQQSGGLLTANNLNVAGTYRITGGAFQVNQDITIEPGGTIDFANSPAALYAGPNSLVQLPVGALNNIGNASLTGDHGSLINYPAGYNPVAHFGHVSSQGLLHEDGTALNIPHDNSVTGRGTIEGNSTNHGAVNPGFGIGELDIAGSYSQASDGALNIELGLVDDPISDLLAASGPITLAGSLNIALLDGFVPSPEDTFTILSGASITGRFDNAFSQVFLGSTGRFDVSYSGNSVSLSNFTTVPEPSTIGAVVTLLGGMMTRRKRASVSRA